ncbi:MAG TPA: alpha/beta hydrolase [Candidatus Rubrimentiphilum sp.]|nr:alpha/beta hydrolase [Candidatus Rubrimentiphilum sp.]
MLREFRVTHSSRGHSIGGHAWEVIACGQGEPALVLLPGGGGSAESQFHLIDCLEKHARVLSIGSPATLARIADAVMGIRAILNDAGIEKCYVLGQSLGGIFAQAYASTFPERVEGLILANTARYSARRAQLVRMALSSAPHVPDKAVVAVLGVRVKRLLRGHPDRDFWLEYFGCDEFRRIGRRGIANLGACIADSVRSDDGARYKGRVLIIESDNDSGFTHSERLALKASYPHAALCTLRGAGHLASITRHAEFTEAVLTFVRGTRSRS